MAERRPNRVIGGVHSEFWAGCDADELRLQTCDVCRGIAWPPVKACDRCGSEQLTWTKMSGDGALVSWTTFERSYYRELPVPWDTVLVELDEGPLFISNPAGFGRDEMRPGLRLRVTFIDCEDDHGSFKLPVFETATAVTQPE